jgi:hypothetical protein
MARLCAGSDGRLCQHGLLLVGRASHKAHCTSIPTAQGFCLFSRDQVRVAGSVGWLLSGCSTLTDMWLQATLWPAPSSEVHPCCLKPAGNCDLCVMHKPWGLAALVGFVS